MPYSPSDPERINSAVAFQAGSAQEQLETANGTAIKLQNESLTIGGEAGQSWGLAAVHNRNILGLELNITGAWSSGPSDPVAAWSISIDSGDSFSSPLLSQAPQEPFQAISDGYVQRTIGSSSTKWGFTDSALNSFDQTKFRVAFTHPNDGSIWFWDHIQVSIYVEGLKSLARICIYSRCKW